MDCLLLCWEKLKDRLSITFWNKVAVILTYGFKWWISIGYHFFKPLLFKKWWIYYLLASLCKAIHNPSTSNFSNKVQLLRVCDPLFLDCGIWDLIVLKCLCRAITMGKCYPTVSEEYLKAVDKCKRKLRGLIAEKNCAPLMLRLAYVLFICPFHFCSF